MSRIELDPHLAREVEAAEVLLLFDGTCGFCTWCAAWVWAHSGAGRVLVLPNQTPGLLDRTGFKRDEADLVALARDVSGKQFRGAAAVNRVFRAMGPPWRQLAVIYRMPGLREIEDAVYVIVASNRSRLSDLFRARPFYE